MESRPDSKAPRARDTRKRDDIVRPAGRPAEAGIKSLAITAMHRMASINEYSTRYVEAIDSKDITPPDAWRLQSSNNKQGSAGLLTEWPEGWLIQNNDDAEPDVGHSGTCDLIHKSVGSTYREPEAGPPDMTPGEHLSWEEKSLHRHAEAVYRRRLALGVAREQARKDLPLSTYTEAYWKMDLHNLMHFLGLRMDSHAQLEIRSYANVIGEQIVAKLFPLAWEAFQDYRMNAKTLTALDRYVIRTLIASGREMPAEMPHIDSTVWPEEWRGKPRNRERQECIDKLQDLLILAAT